MDVSEPNLYQTDDAPDPAKRMVIGQRLAEAREVKGWSVDDIAARLNLRPSFVAAVEEGRGHEHMSWGYEKNHIRTIASILSIDVPQDL